MPLKPAARGVAQLASDELLEKPPTIDLNRIEQAVREILVAIGENPEREGLKGTPDRVARMMQEIFGGLKVDPADCLETVFTEEKYNDVVLLRNIDFHSVCEHHLLPVVGVAHVAYLPNRKIVGLSKLARLVEGYARRPQIQERMTTQIADALHDRLQPNGVAVYIEATHMCMTMRGIKRSQATMITSAVRGVYASDESRRREIRAMAFAPQSPA
ncbi:MAG: GTP cyclohydrolase I FolE [Planctomycetota bacterium]